MKRYKKSIIYGFVVLATLAFVYWWGGDAPSLRGWETGDDNIKTITSTPEKTDNEKTNTHQNVKIQDEKNEPDLILKKKENDLKSGENDKVLQTQPKEEIEKVEKTENETQSISKDDEEKWCTISVRCDTVLKNLSFLDAEKAAIIPQNGVLLAEQRAMFYEGESVFHVLKREMKRNKIHFEFMNTPIYKTAYIEGIGNLYEFDCGELSGWLYKVNGEFPECGCSDYKLKENDKVEWVYTSDFGADVGDILGNGKKQKGE